jgi:type I restriction enzyme, S subunit
LLEGLEVSELTLSEIQINNRTFRVDSSYFNKNAVKIDKELKKLEHEFIVEKNIVSGPFGSTLKSDAYLSEGVPFVRIENIKGGFEISKNTIIYISETDNNRLKNSQLQIDDLVLSKVGNTIGYYARVDEELGNCNISENNIGIKLSSFPEEKRHYFLTFLNSKYGNILTLRRISGNAQPKLNVFDISEIPIPKRSIKFEKLISNLILKSRSIKYKSVEKYKDAETILLELTNLKDFEFSKDPINVKDLSHSFFKTGRLDAEYYQKKYEEVIEHIKTQKYDTLIDLVRIKKSIEPGSDAYSEEGGLPFYRVSDYNKYGLSKPDKELKEIFVSENSELIEKLKPKQGTILFSKDGSVGTAYLLRKDLDGITSGAILHLTIRDKKQIIPEYLTLALNSKLVQMQAERDAGGSIILHWRVGEIENVVVPIIDYTKQEEIAELVEESFKLKKQSENILEVAKRAVEIAIEENEVEALKYIENANIN